VNPETIAETSAKASGLERGEPPVGQPHDAAAGHGEHQLVGMLADDSRRDRGGDEPGNRNSPGLVRFRGAEDDAPADVGEGAPDIDAAAVEVDVADAQGGGVAPAQAGVAEHQDQKPPRASCDGQVEDLTVSQEYVVAALGPGQVQAVSWVDANPAGPYGVIKRGGHDEH
jgi:hypothetical protein